MLTDAAGRSIRRELIEFINDLDVDEAAALVALAWIGRADFQPEEWKIAVAQAKEQADGSTWKYLLEMKLLPDYLEDALSVHARAWGLRMKVEVSSSRKRRYNLLPKRETAAKDIPMATNLRNSPSAGVRGGERGNGPSRFGHGVRQEDFFI